MKPEANLPRPLLFEEGRQARFPGSTVCLSSPFDKEGSRGICSWPEAYA